MRNAKKQLLALALSLLLITPVMVLAQSNETSTLWGSQLGVGEVGTVYGQSKDNPQDLRITIVRLINTVMIVLGVIFFVLFLFSGFQWMTSGGNADGVKQAKSRMANAAIGVTIALVSWSITFFILRRLVAIVTNNVNYRNPY